MKQNSNFKTREEKFQKIWEKQNWNQAVDFDQQRKKKYVLVEFPYPSGSGLHVGHAFTMTGADVYARKKRMDGMNVLFPMGWDAFGLPTENYAIKFGVSPQKATKDNTDNFRKQMKRMAFSFDWDREINTTDPNYYHWTQWIFIQLFKKGLAYKQKKPINWCPSCKIGLANEEVVDGKCERCGAGVSKKNLSQWIVKITDYADRLIEGLKQTRFVPKVAAAQTNWIGKSQGVIIDYPLVGKTGKVSCYSTRPDTNFGATFVVIAPEHSQVMELTTKENQKAVLDYIKQAKKKSELERTELSKERSGVFTGSYCLNRLTKKRMPIYVADFVIPTAGTGIVVGVPAHDKRDWDFAQKYNLEIIPVIKPKGKKKWDFAQAPFVDIDDAVVFNSKFLNGLPALKAKEVIINYLVKKGWGRRSENFHLRDWIFSRQHYWGEPIPMIYCPDCAKKGVSWFDVGSDNQSQIKERREFKVSDEVKQKTIGWFPVADDQLPVKLPKVEKYQPTDTGESPLSVMTDWLTTKCPHCGGSAVRESDTMPNWAGSDWYYLAYIFANQLKKGATSNIFEAAKDLLNYWLPVDIYIGGDEHNTLHLLYSRFIYQFLWDLGVMPDNKPEPYYQRISHGVILGPDNQRMSKSRGNVIEPDKLIKKYGVDAVRTYMTFMGPFDATLAWNDNALRGVARFLTRFEEKVRKQLAMTPAKRMESKKAKSDLVNSLVNITIKRVSDDLDGFKFNTAIAHLMSFIKEVQDQDLVLTKSDWSKIIKLLAPFAPYLAEELWQALGQKTSIHAGSWPKCQKEFLVDQAIEVVVQVNGKVRSTIKLDASWAREQKQVEEAAKLEANVLKYLEGKKIIKVIFVPQRLINFVVK